jgi:hypothetical protein
MLEWRNPELLFRYYQDNFADPEMAPIVNRWLRAIFATSPETTREIRRRDPANLRHLSKIDPLVLERWYDKACPGTASMRTLFMVRRHRPHRRHRPRCAAAPALSRAFFVPFPAARSRRLSIDVRRGAQIGEDAGSCLRVISTLKNKFNRALMGYCLQSHVRVLVVFDSVKRCARAHTRTPRGKAGRQGRPTEGWTERRLGGRTEGWIRDKPCHAHTRRRASAARLASALARLSCVVSSLNGRVDSRALLPPPSSPLPAPTACSRAR